MSVLPTLPTLCFQNQNGYMYIFANPFEICNWTWNEMSRLVMRRNQNLRELSVNVIYNFTNC